MDPLNSLVFRIDERQRTNDFNDQRQGRKNVFEGLIKNMKIGGCTTERE